MSHVAAIVGGFSSQQKNIGQQGVLFRPMPRDKQAMAVRFLNDNAFQTPTWAINPEILRRIEPVGVLDRIRTGQLRVLNSLLSSPRIGRLVEQEALDGPTVYRPLEFLSDVRKGVWSEFYNGTPVKVDAYRRNLQRAYIETLADRINGRLAAVDDSRAFFRGELKTLDADLRAAMRPDDGSRDEAAHRRRAHADRACARPDRAGAGRNGGSSARADRRHLRRVG